MSSRPTLRRAGLVLAVSALVAGALNGCGEESPEESAPAAPEYDTAGLAAAGDWLTGQLDEGLLAYRTDFGPYTDYGLSIDAAMAMAATDDTETVQEINEAVAAGLESYISGDALGDPGSTYAGPAAKTLVMAQLAGDDPSSYGGLDLVETVESVTSSDPVIAGRLEDKSTFGDNANVLGQTMAARGLAEAGSARAGDALAFLLEQQCSEGYFRLSFTPDKKADDQSCDAGTDDESAPDVDTTALAVLSLQNLTDQADVPEALDRAIAWLVEQQGENGAFRGGTDAAADNSNSTGLAGWALGSQGETDAAESAAAWVRSLQAGAAGDCAAWHEGQVGAIAYDQAAYDAAGDKGITGKAMGQWMRATAQALPVLQWTPTTDSEETPCGSSG
jgi:hypothetical protein